MIMRELSLTDKSRLKKLEIAILIAVATITITFVSTSSPLYPFNPWDDTNVFLTVGRCMVHGWVPYRDIFDHKGPLLYFIYALAALISDKSFTGVWVVECIAASVFAIYSWKIAKLFVEPSKHAIALMPLFLGIVYTSNMFNYGGNTEELCFPLLTIVLFIVLRSIVVSDGLPGKAEALVCGIITGCLFWLKYTFLGFMLGVCLYILLLTIKRKDFKTLWSLVWRFITGFIIIAVPILVYFAATGSLGYLWEAYFYDNIFLYSNSTSDLKIASIPVVKNIVIPAFSILTSSLKNPSFGILLLTTFISLIFVPMKYRKKVCVLYFLTFILSAGFLFTRSSFIYYYAYLLCYGFGFALLPFIKGLNQAENIFKQNKSFIRGFLTAVLIVFYGISILLCKNMYLIFQPKTYLAQYRFAETINQTPNAKVLTYDVMDAGFYTAAGILPSNRYCAHKMFGDNYPQLREEQDRLISEGYFDYVVTSFFCECDWDNYVLIKEEKDTCVDYTGKKALDGFRLYKRA